MSDFTANAGKDKAPSRSTRSSLMAEIPMKSFARPSAVTACSDDFLEGRFWTVAKLVE
jgi:hypothetical protein